MTAAERAAEVAEMPHVRRWLRRFQALSRAMPPEVQVLVMSGTPCVVALDRDGSNFTRRSSALCDHPSTLCCDQAAVVCTVTGGRWDGGEW